MKHALLALPILLGTTALAPAMAQVLPAPPTHAQGVAADTRQGSIFNDNGTTIFYQVTGSGTPLVLIHGYPLSGALFQFPRAGLASKFQVITLDLPGFGLTGPDPSGDYSDERSVAVVAALMDRLGLARATLVGNSMGGNIAWRFAAAHPDRTTKLVLISPAGFRPPGETGTRPTSLPFTIRMMRYVLPMPVLRMNMQASYADPSRLTPALMTRYRDMLLVPGIRSAILSRMLQTNWPDPVPILRSIQTPTLLIWGENDRLIPFRNSADYLAALPHATLAPLPGQGHAPQEEAPNLSLAPLRAFLAS